MKEFVEKLIGRLEEKEKNHLHDEKVMQEMGRSNLASLCYAKASELEGVIQIVKDLASEHNNGWISVEDALPESENKNCWVSCIVSVVRSHYPTSTYDICDAPYDENIVMHANYDVSQKIWHLECDEQLNALIDIEDAPLNGDYVEAWQPLPAPYKKGE